MPPSTTSPGTTRSTNTPTMTITTETPTSTYSTTVSTSEIPSTTPHVITTTGCIDGQQCEWSSWIDSIQPTTGNEGGDRESIQEIFNSGTIICNDPVAIECRAKEFPKLQLSDLGQDVECNRSVGLICQNKNQGLQKQCFDYEIKVKCCQSCYTTILPQSTSTPGTTTFTTVTTTTEPPTSTSTTTMPPSTTSPGTTRSANTPTMTITTETPTSTYSTTVSTSQIPSTTPHVITTTGCIDGQQCEWSSWIDSIQPTTGNEGGDRESIQEIFNSGTIICNDPVAIECRAKEFPKLQLSDLGQDVECNRSVGLICLNKNQGLQKQCFDYEIKVKCCQSCYTTTTST